MKPYPEGEDRNAIDGAFQNLVDTIKTEPTERGVRMFEKRGEYGITQAEVDQNFAQTMDDMAVGKRAPTFPIPLGMTPEPM